MKRIKHIKHWLATMSVLLCSITASAHDFEVDGIYYNITAEVNEAEVTYKGNSDYEYDDEYSGSINIPAMVSYKGVNYSVTSIGNSAFDGCWRLTSITIPEGVASIGDSAFSNCISLTSITLPEGVTSIGEWAFWNCRSLTTITIPASVTSIGYYAFGACISLASFNMPENSSLTSIGTGAFHECSGLTSITIPEGVTSIGNQSFYACSSLETIIIPSSVTSIGIQPFLLCSSLAAIVVAEGNAVYDSRGGCNAIIETNSNTLIAGCSTTIIPESVTSIGADAFACRSNLTSITIPEGVASIGDGAFAGCSSLAAIVVAEGNAVYDSRGGCNAIIETNSNTLIAGCSTTIIPEGVKSIGDYAFYGCTSLTAINIPESVTSIGEWAFTDCRSLATIYMPENSQLTSIGECAFLYCSSLTSITIPASVTSIASGAFASCSSLVAINIPENSQLTSIGGQSFENCSSLTSITIPSSVTSIVDWAFYNCTKLQDVYCYAENVPLTETGAFDGSYPERATLHVPASALDTYKNTAPWNGFGTIVSLTDEEMGIDKSEIKNQDSGIVYDLHGRRVENPGKGIYIMGGKKVAIK